MATGIVALIPNIWHVLRFFTVLLKGTVRGFAFDFELAIYGVESPKHRVLAGSLAGRRPTVIWILILFSGNATTLHRFERKAKCPPVPSLRMLAPRWRLFDLTDVCILDIRSPWEFTTNSRTKIPLSRPDQAKPVASAGTRFLLGNFTVAHQQTRTDYSPRKVYRGSVTSQLRSPGRLTGFIIPGFCWLINSGRLLVLCSAIEEETYDYTSPPTWMGYRRQCCCRRDQGIRSAPARLRVRSSSWQSRLYRRPKGKIYYKGDSRYEIYRLNATWNARKPNRFPNAIVLAEDVNDVIAAVQLAKQRGWQVSTRSGRPQFHGLAYARQRRPDQRFAG